jgi:hypothetical protein
MFLYVGTHQDNGRDDFMALTLKRSRVFCPLPSLAPLSRRKRHSGEIKLQRRIC